MSKVARFSADVVPFTVERTDTTTPTTVISTLDGPHGIGEGLLSFLDFRTATKLRSTCSELKDSVAKFPWGNIYNLVTRPTEWRKCFPKATYLKINRMCVAINFNVLRGIKILDLSFTNSLLKFEGSLSSLTSLETLLCDSATSIDDDDIAGLNIKHLNINNCPQLTVLALEGLNRLEILHMQRNNIITPQSFDRLTALKELHISGCTMITDRHFENLTSLEVLDMKSCSTEFLPFTPDAFKNLQNLKALDINFNQYFTPDFFKHLKNLKKLSAAGCNITDECLQSLPNLEILLIENNPLLTDDAFKNFVCLKNVILDFCDQITDRAFSFMGTVQKLSLVGCTQDTITVKCLEHMKNLKVLDIRGDGKGNKSLYSKEAFLRYAKLDELRMSCCVQADVTDQMHLLRGLKFLKMAKCGDLSSSHMVLHGGKSSFHASCRHDMYWRKSMIADLRENGTMSYESDYSSDESDDE